MSTGKKFRLAPTELQQLIPSMGYCFVTDMITVEGMKVGYMYRDEAEDDEDSGWQFFSGTESEDYVDTPENLEIMDVNTVANYDPAIIAYLDTPPGNGLERIEGTDTFRIVESD